MAAEYIRIYFKFPTEQRRSPLLEALFARAEETAAVADWRQDAFAMIAPGVDMPPIAPVAFAALIGPARGAYVAIASPVSCIAEMSDVRLAADGVLALEPHEAMELAAEFNRIWSDAKVRLEGARCGRLFFVFESVPQLRTHDPHDLRGRPIGEFLPTGADAPSVKRLLSEIEMWLFEHAINEARRSRSAPLITGLWPWGGGAAGAQVPYARGWQAGNDIFFDSFLPQRPQRAAPGDSGIIVIHDAPGSHTWSCRESRDLAPAVANLRAGRIERLVLCTDRQAFQLTRASSWRFWRARKPWWQTVGGET